MEPRGRERHRREAHLGEKAGANESNALQNWVGVLGCSCDSRRCSYNRLVFARHDRTPERNPHSVLRHCLHAGADASTASADSVNRVFCA